MSYRKITAFIQEQSPTGYEDAMIALKLIPKLEAKALLHKFIVTHSGAVTGDIIIETGLDPELAVECLEELEAEEKVHSRDIRCPRAPRRT
jgi:hypothetical protein